MKITKKDIIESYNNWDKYLSQQCTYVYKYNNDMVVGRWRVKKVK